MEYADSPFEIKSITEAGHIEGYASIFGNVDSYGEVVDPGAFASSLARRNGTPLPMLYQHDVKRPIGVWTELRETQKGLWAKGKMTIEAQDGRDAHALAKAGALTGLSIGYRVPKGGSTLVGEHLHLTVVDLVETSLVTIPANDRARVSAVKAIESPGDIEDYLRSGGWSGRMAKKVASLAWRIKHEQRDEEAAEAELAALFRASAARLQTLGGKS